jgi:heme A synthase
MRAMNPRFVIAAIGLVIVSVLAVWNWGVFLRSRAQRRHPVAWALFLTLCTLLPIGEEIIALLPALALKSVLASVANGLLLAIQGTLFTWRQSRRRPASPDAPSEEDTGLVLRAVGVLGAIFLAMLVLIGLLIWRSQTASGTTRYSSGRPGDARQDTLGAARVETLARRGTAW